MLGSWCTLYEVKRNHRPCLRGIRPPGRGVSHTGSGGSILFKRDLVNNRPSVIWPHATFLYSSRRRSCAHNQDTATGFATPGPPLSSVSSVVVIELHQPSLMSGPPFVHTGECVSRSYANSASKIDTD
ncbi:unnamed protein product [Soboliphyme baturini]|uniref:Uncharacterized protein n=1 Tax=Soboliphyme baturini TaxID=241478 RepID=A0A183IF94_9BILA|nr:unnamed protein product [Soboliphyme baturini]